jgi:UrcA family protein
MKMLFIAAAATALLCSPASAAKRDAVKLEIQTAGVNFADPLSVEAFRARATRQIADFCNPDDQIGVTSPDRQCRRELTANLNRMVSNLAVASVSGGVQRN